MCDTWPHHRLLHADELRNAPSPFFISSEKSLLKVIRARAHSPALGLAVQEEELFGLLTWMNCWGNAEAGNGWIVYINMINIALINHLSVIYCRFSHLALTRKLWRISQWSFSFSLQRRFWVFNRSFSGILVLHSSIIIRVSAPRWLFTGLCQFLYKQLLRWKNGGELKGSHVHEAWTCFLTAELLMSSLEHGDVFHFGPDFASVFFFLNRSSVLLKEHDVFLWEGRAVLEGQPWPASSLVHPVSTTASKVIFCE